MTRRDSSGDKFVSAASLLALVAAAILLLPLAGCRGGTEGETGAAATTSTPLPTATTTATPTLTSAPTSTPSPTISYSSPGISPPPAAMLTSRAGTQEGAIGSFCWTADDGRGGCIDMIGIPAPDAALSVDAGERLAFSVEGFERFVHVEVEVYDYARTEMDGSLRLILYPPPERLEIPFEADGGAIILAAELPPGEYVVAVSVWFPLEAAPIPAPGTAETTARGDAVYGFHIEVTSAGK